MLCTAWLRRPLVCFCVLASSRILPLGNGMVPLTRRVTEESQDVRLLDLKQACLGERGCKGQCKVAGAKPCEEFRLIK